MRILIIALFLSVVPSQPVIAGWFYEHKLIGDSAFKEFIRKNNLETFFDTLGYKKYGNDIEIPFRKGEPTQYYHGMFAFSDSAYLHHYSYGDFSGLAGDHALDFIQLMTALLRRELLIEDQTLYPRLNADIHKALSSHFEGIEEGKNQGSYSSLQYLFLAAEDKSHFQDPPKDRLEMLKGINKNSFHLIDTVRESRPPVLGDLRNTFAKMLLGMNNTSKYALLHLLAQDLMVSAARLRALNAEEEFQSTLKWAFITNAFADHFLQDAFAGGHLPVQRDANGLDNNGVHDFYCRIGLHVQNENGEKWKTYGDNFYEDITFSQAIKANIISLEELWHWFDSTYYATLNNKVVWSVYKKMTADSIPENQYAVTLDQLMNNEYAAMPTPLDEKFYEDSIRLKRGSKNGAFYELGVASAFVPHDFGNNFMIHAGVGLGYNLVKYRERPPDESSYQNRSESRIWVGPSLNYSRYSYEDNDENRIYLGLNATWLDRLTFTQGIGRSFYSDKGNAYAVTSLGLELKYLSCRLAPSVKYYVEFQNAHQPVHGVQAVLRFY